MKQAAYLFLEMFIKYLQQYRTFYLFAKAFGQLFVPILSDLSDIVDIRDNFVFVLQYYVLNHMSL